MSLQFLSQGFHGTGPRSLKMKILTDFVGCAKLKTVSKKKILKVWNCHDGKDGNSRCGCIPCIPGMMCSGVAFHSLPSFEPKKNSKVDCSLWQTQHDGSYPLQGLRNYQSNHLLGKTHGSKQHFYIRIFFPKKMTTALFSSKTAVRSGVPDTSESGPFAETRMGWNSPWRWCLGHDTIWGYEAMILVWYWQTSIYLDILILCYEAMRLCFS